MDIDKLILHFLFPLIIYRFSSLMDIDKLIHMGVFKQYAPVLVH